MVNNMVEIESHFILSSHIVAPAPVQNMLGKNPCGLGCGHTSVAVKAENWDQQWLSLQEKGQYTQKRVWGRQNKEDLNKEPSGTLDLEPRAKSKKQSGELRILYEKFRQTLI